MKVLAYLCRMKHTCFVLLLIFLFAGSCTNVGNKLYKFEAATLSGKKISDESLKGKITVIKIWATWCGPCVMEIPHLNELEKKYHSDTNIVFLAITDDSSEKIRNFLSSHQFAYEHVTDARKLKHLFQRGPVKTIPEHIVIDPELNIVFDESGSSPDIAAKLDSVISEIN